MHDEVITRVRALLAGEGADPEDLERALAELAPALARDPADPELRHHHALTRALRYSVQADPEEDFTAAHAEFTALLRDPGYTRHDAARLTLVLLLSKKLQPRATRRPTASLGAALISQLMTGSAHYGTDQTLGVLAEIAALLAELSPEHRQHPRIAPFAALIDAIPLLTRGRPDDGITRLRDGMTNAEPDQRALFSTLIAAAQPRHDAEAVREAEQSLTDDVPMAAQFRDALSLLKFSNDLDSPFDPHDLPAAFESTRRTLALYPPGRENVLDAFVTGVAGRILLSRSPHGLDQLRAFYQEETSHAPDDSRYLLMLGTLDLMMATLRDEPVELTAAVARLEHLRRTVAEDDVVHGIATTYLATALAQRAISSHSLQDLETALRVAAEGESNADPVLAGLGSLSRAVAELAAFQHELPDEGRLQAVAARYERLHPRVRELVHIDVDAQVGNLRALAALARSAGERMEGFSSPALPQYDDLGRAVTLAQNGLVARDTGLIDEGLALARQHQAPNLRESVRVARFIGTAAQFRYFVTRSADDLDATITQLEHVVDLIRTEPGLANVSDAHFQLAEALHVRGDAVRAAECGIDALRERAKDVLLQADAGHALTMAEHAQGQAVTIVGWCLAAERADLAVRALELGRSLVLHTVSAEATITDLLHDADRPDLAAEWTGTGDEPSELRHRVLTAITGSQAAQQLLRPLEFDDVRTALQRAGSDALVYLLPGFALIVTDDGVEHFPLPELDSGPIERFEQARRTLVDPSREEETHWRATLTATCSWAWDAVMGPLLKEFPGLPRLVLVPVGALAAIPWHAAHGARKGRARYACQDAIISYAASARQFTDAAQRDPRPIDDVALVRVQDAALHWATAEIEALRKHYPNAVVVENVRPADVLRHLPNAAVLHLSCHAHCATPAVESHLALDNGEVLPIRDVLRQARHRGVDGGLVVLASCASDLTDTAHDEALTLATAFLSAGATGAVGARWPITDLAATFFVIMFHHHLGRGPGDPAIALRATQVWMLDPNRRLPSVDTDLAGLARIAHLDDPANWAAFTYQGR